jgi:catechol 2,3-dioxygenase
MASSAEAMSTESRPVGDDGVPNPVMHHINLKTTRLGEMIDWYGQVCGMRPNFRSEVIAFLTNDAANHRLALLSVPGLSEDPDRVAHCGMHHSAFEFETLEQLLTRYGSLKANGIEPHACLDHGLTTSFYYEDPDGNSVELQADNFGDWASSTAWVRTAPEFVANPIGVYIDPEQTAEALRAGASAEEIHRRGYAGEFAPAVPQDLHLP